MESIQSATRGIKRYFIVVLCCVFVFLLVTVKLPPIKVVSHMITFGDKHEDEKTKNNDCIAVTVPVTEQRKTVLKEEDRTGLKENNPKVSKKEEQRRASKKEVGKVSQEKYLKDLVLRLKAQNKPIVYAVANDGFIPLADSWLCNTMYMGVHEQVLVVTPDDKTKKYFLNKWPKINVISQPTEGLGGNQNYGRVGYWRMNIKRITWTLMLLELGIEVFMVEMDSIWFVNPIPHLMNLSKEVDIVTLNPGFMLDYVCAGFVYVKPTDKSINMWKKLIEILEATGKKMKGLKEQKSFDIKKEADQAVLTRLVIKEKYGGIKYQPAPYERYPDGLWYNKQTPKNPDVIQFNFVIGNQRKIDRAKKFRHWFVSDKTHQCDIEHVKNMTSRNSV